MSGQRPEVQDTAQQQLPGAEAAPAAHSTTAVRPSTVEQAQHSAAQCRTVQRSAAHQQEAVPPPQLSQAAQVGEVSIHAE